MLTTFTAKAKINFHADQKQSQPRGHYRPGEITMSMPYSGKQFTFFQPDGTPLWVKGWGNQYYAVFEALNGYTLVKNPVTGFYVYAKDNLAGEDLLPSNAIPRIHKPQHYGLIPGVRAKRGPANNHTTARAALMPGKRRWEQRRNQFKTALASAVTSGNIAAAPPSRNTVGTRVGLCILIDFPDVPGTISQSEISDFCNKVGYNGFGNNGSVHDYFLEISGGKLNYTNIVTPYYTAKHERAHYTSDSADHWPTKARELIREALDHFKASGFDFSRLTTDSQGFVNATNVFYAGSCPNAWGEGLWPHAHVLEPAHQLAADKQAHDYQITDMTEELSLGTFCHENGHMICDFPDLYDDDKVPMSAGIAEFCLMCAGGNADPKNPPHVNAYLKYSAGWAQVTNITANLNATVSAGQNRFYIHRKNHTEYFIIENRLKARRDLALPSQGLAVWHVDEQGDNRHEQMTSALHYECSLMQADGRNDLESDARNTGDETDLFSAAVNDHFGPGTNPGSKWWDGTSSTLDISEISSAGATMTFKGNV
jgi:M6 family metalloprotease-like protein